MKKLDSEAKYEIDKIDKDFGFNYIKSFVFQKV